MNGFNISEAGHIVPLILPKSVSGGVTGQPFSMKGAEHVSIIISVGALAAQLGVLTLNACSDVGGDGATAIPFRYYQQSTAGAGNDKLDTGPVAATASGFTPPNTPNVIYTIELDSSELNFLGDGDSSDLPYLQLSVADGSNADFVSAVAILSGLRNQYQKNPTQTV
jgi:hypothetical protein